MILIFTYHLVENVGIHDPNVKSCILFVFYSTDSGGPTIILSLRVRVRVRDRDRGTVRVGITVRVKVRVRVRVRTRVWAKVRARVRGGSGPPDRDISRHFAVWPSKFAQTFFFFSTQTYI
jgi:hypothetical protein